MFSKSSMNETLKCSSRSSAAKQIGFDDAIFSCGVPFMRRQKSWSQSAGSESSSHP